MFTKRKVLVFVVLLVLALLAISELAGRNISLEGIRNYVNSFGSLAPIVLLIIIIVTSSIGFVFMVPVAVAALLLNIWMAFVVSIIGLNIGAAISFILARYIGRDYFERKYVSKIKWLKKYDKHLESRGFLAIFFLRLISLIPYELVNIGAGLSRIKFSRFMAGTFLGGIPGSIITIYFISTTENLFSMEFYFALIVIGVFSIIPLLSKRVREIVF